MRVDADCGGGQVCFACQCESAGAQLGPLAFSVVPGPADANPADDGQSTLLRVTPLFGITNGTPGQLQSRSAAARGGRTRCRTDAPPSC